MFQRICSGLLRVVTLLLTIVLTFCKAKAKFGNIWYQDFLKLQWKRRNSCKKQFDRSKARFDFHTPRGDGAGIISIMVILMLCKCLLHPDTCSIHYDFLKSLSIFFLCFWMGCIILYFEKKAVAFLFTLVSQCFRWGRARRKYMYW